MNTLQFLTGLIFGVLLAAVSWRVKALDRSGAWAAALTGGLIFALGGFNWGVLLLAFFISSSSLSKANNKRKASLGEKFAKGSQRDWGQVLANGGLGTLLVVIQMAFPSQVWPWLAFAGAMATVNADTWATELGVLSTLPPRLITSGKAVERGASGGVTKLGTLATFGGAGFIALIAGLLNPQIGLLDSFFPITLAGLLGATLDSLFGATIQAMYYCPLDQKETESYPVHTCGTPTVLHRGWPWFNNDLVNFFSSIFGALAVVGVWLLLS
ncbi:MAG: DUF92 domain-containing protein [Chloroflexi bacterium]|nr:DUF92 domain-containing protein [Chloroflexota bacterium]